MADLTIVKGDTLNTVWMWGTNDFSYKPITGISKGAPALITATAHGIPDGWPVAVVSVKGMTQINAAKNPPRYSEYREAVVVDANTIALNEVNSSDFSPYVSGGFLMYNTPVDMTGYSARANIKDKVGGNVLLDLTPYLSVNNTTKLITCAVPASVTAAITWSRGVFDLELYTASDAHVEKIDAGNVLALAEVTT